MIVVLSQKLRKALICLGWPVLIPAHIFMTECRAANTHNLAESHKSTGKPKPAKATNPVETPSQNLSAEEKRMPTPYIPPHLNLSQEMMTLLNQYRTLAEAHITTQQNLRAQLRGATLEQLSLLKQQLRSNKDLFMQEAVLLRFDLQERMIDLKSSLQEVKALEAATQELSATRRRGGP